MFDIMLSNLQQKCHRVAVGAVKSRLSRMSSPMMMYIAQFFF